MTHVGLIEIATDNDGYAYAIFETVNDCGKPLSPVDWSCNLFVDTRFLKGSFASRNLWVTGSLRSSAA